MNYFQLTENNELPAIGQFAPFKVVLAIEDNVSRARRHEVANWLVEQGGRYVMVCGADCDDWVESIRRANLDQVNLRDMKPEQFVMITTHAHEKLRGVFWHARKHARHTHVTLDNILTIHVGKQQRSVEYHALFDKF